VLGVSPARSIQDHVQNYGFKKFPYTLIRTGFGRKGRNIISLRTCDAAIFISGRMGTLNEFTICWDTFGPQNVIGLLGGSGGVVDKEIRSLVERLATEKPSAAQENMIWESNPEHLVERVFEKLAELNPK
jgi:hypothetical protein